MAVKTIVVFRLSQVARFTSRTGLSRVFRQNLATMILGGLVTLSTVGIFPAGAGAQSAADFKRDIKPILAEHCWKCHSEKRAAGGLRLDQRKFAERGGGSGKDLLELNRNHNELLRRVRSTVAAERMPREAPPLATAQIELLERWILQGAAWPDSPEVEPVAHQQPLTELWLDRLAYTTTSRYLPAYFLLMSVLISIIVVERAKRARQEARMAEGKAARAVQKQLARLSRAWYLVLLLGIVVFVVVQLCREQRDDLQQARRALHAKGGSPLAGDQPKQEPQRPMHPPRLGGEYYRGNDERSPELFNGGFYRTAKFEVYLTDAEGGRLAWGDPVPDQPHLLFAIERAAHSNPTLFAPEIMENAGLTSVQPEQMATAKSIPFFQLRTDLPGERWSVLFPLETIPATGKLTGKAFLYKGSPQDEQHRSAEPWYLIGYELSADGGKISRESNIWMASIYAFSLVVTPGPGQIPADQWFDFRPIPEIEK